MRKIIAGDSLGPKGSDYAVVLKNNDGSRTDLFRKQSNSALYPNMHDTNATVEFVNKVLTDRSESTLTEEEVYFLMNPKFEQMIGVQ